MIGNIRSLLNYIMTDGNNQRQTSAPDARSAILRPLLEIGALYVAANAAYYTGSFALSTTYSIGAAGYRLLTGKSSSKTIENTPKIPFSPKDLLSQRGNLTAPKISEVNRSWKTAYESAARVLPREVRFSSTKQAFLIDPKMPYTVEKMIFSAISKSISEQGIPKSGIVNSFVQSIAQEIIKKFNAMKTNTPSLTNDAALEIIKNKLPASIEKYNTDTTEDFDLHYDLQCVIQDRTLVQEQEGVYSTSILSEPDLKILQDSTVEVITSMQENPEIFDSL